MEREELTPHQKVLFMKYLFFCIISLSLFVFGGEWEIQDYEVSGQCLAWREYRKKNANHIDKINITKQKSSDYHINIWFKFYDTMVSSKFNNTVIQCCGCNCSYAGKDVNTIAMIFNKLYTVEPLTEIMPNIVQFMSIRLSDPNIMLELAKLGKNKDALAYAVEYASVDMDLLWQLAEHYYVNKNFKKALDVYQEIEESNPHFKEAAVRSDSIISEVLSLNKQGQYELTEEEKRSLIKARFKFALQAKESRFAGRLFEELFKIKLSEEAIENFKGDYYTLIAIGDAIKK
jgi:hypothetical protein